MRSVGVLLVFLTLVPSLLAQVKVGGREIVPKGLIFADPDPKSTVTAEGELEDGCGWTLEGETRFAEERAEEECVLDYRRTTVLLTRKCPAPAKPEPVVAERTTTAPKQRCPDEGGELAELEVETRAISSGTTPDGKRQAILTQPDGTRLTMSWDMSGARVVIRFPDATTDVLQVAAQKPSE